MSSYAHLLNSSSSDDIFTGYVYPTLSSPNDNNLFTIPCGLSPADLLDSPVLFSSSNILPSPTTGTSSYQEFNWNIDSISNNNKREQGVIKQEQNYYSDFTTIPNEQAPWIYQNFTKKDGHPIIKSEFQPMRSFSPDIASTLTTQCDQPSQPVREKKRSEDKFNWRKYGQKQVKGSENPRSYYKCTYPKCPMRKIVETSVEGHITEIIYKGSHTHPIPLSTKRSSSSPASSEAMILSANEIPDQSYGLLGSAQEDSAATPENSSISIVDDDAEQNSQRSMSEFDDDEPDAKRWRTDSENEIVSAPGSRTVREPRVVVQTISDIDILDDGYRWRKYGQKVVKGNPNPRSYYKCTNSGCLVTKQVERASHDLKAVITTYQGKHNHDTPAAQRCGNHSVNKTMLTNGPVATRPSVTPNLTNSSLNNSLQSFGAPTFEGQEPYTLEMLQGMGSFGFSEYENQIL
ncbi:WRKY transcription factor [Heracleum sosnowskyi]|uniref:WRKY transcription factor n=1 Tax=Heracleum sosnowskyi TaxID=360622 RepID=A0AAD8LYZ2_9APIA|nr:WRKY transcription factor [Heracleum sosnowskyi]